MNHRNKYLLQRILHFSSGIIYSIYYSFFSRKRTKTVIFNSACNQEFTWNAKNLFLHSAEKLKKIGFSVYFVINDSEKRAYLNDKYGNYFISNMTLKNKIKIYKSAVWVLSTLETPCSGVFLNKNRFVYHLGHGTPIKNIGLCENNLSILKKIFYKLNTTNISLFLSSSTYFVPYMAKAFGVKKNKIIVSPQPRIVDLLTKSSFSIEKEKDTKYILYAPTWRHYDEVKLFPFIHSNKGFTIFNQKLERLGIIILLRLHPRFEFNIEKYLTSNIINFNSSLCEDISEALNQTDALITDYSSIYCDYLLLNKPVAVIPYDLDRYVSEIGFSHNYSDIFPKTIISTEKEFLSFCERVKNNNFDFIEQNLLSSKLNFIPENSNIIDFNIAIISEEYSKRWPEQ
ncbi:MULTISPECIES: CDP-glycerol glycerophosphotransferase family protein [Providencia]|uniref:CDP-glycerol glycerophosphotransferase family protein n=1 Tax=Providencia TaxID=586 RepID=UPI0014197F70|nr:MULTISPECIES: CDP-glycerol glycerophosphotransferase family protein [Providencia]ELR5146630.1 CDP-glycerol glycerophosphotransferase family protein [Providencia rettgeri]NIA44653.1 hypothetical protein [Providencia rettgeri]NIA96919.1 hypothetical protein [Providencia rettgeri]NIB14743.1 hypothetical protein [Providencia rettgeri]NIB34955.1 hypothetical protein [Providencia rettgeri]